MDDTITATLGRIIREQREWMDWSRYDLARESGIHRTTIRELEKGKARSSLVTYAAIAKALGLHLYELVALAESDDGDDVTVEPMKVARPAIRRFITKALTGGRNG
jgi:ribosome-binding protein aMBF1 (putative translation factor)